MFARSSSTVSSVAEFIASKSSCVCIVVFWSSSFIVVDMILISGDLIDHIKNVYVNQSEYNETVSIPNIWETVKISDDNTKYNEFVDYISLYSLIIDFYSGKGAKPVFIVSGNHDCYDLPYGVSPKVKYESKWTIPLPKKWWKIWDWEWRKISLTPAEDPNPNIPPDHNLTQYEANLIFGDTCHETNPSGDLIPKYFVAENFKWFYSALTPFSDFSFHLSKQIIIGLSWGEDEDLLDVPLVAQGLGHLPRAEEAISDKQLELINKGIENNISGSKRVILFSHFTSVSYDDSISLETAKDKKGYIRWKGYGKYDLGTFEKNRKKLFKSLVLKGKIHYILTGHSHRRGLYSLTKMLWSLSNKTGMPLITTGAETRLAGDFSGRVTEPAIIVSDSSGPLPRHNIADEFSGWGSDYPGGLKIIFNGSSSAAIEPVQIESSACRPRFAVAVDNMDVIAGKDVIEKFESDEIEEDTEKIIFTIKLHDDLCKEIKIEKVIMYNMASADNWNKLESGGVAEGGDNDWRVEFDDATQRFNKYIKNSFKKDTQNFMAIQFSILDDKKGRYQQYNFEDYWTFEFRIEKGWFSERYSVERDKKFSRKPNFEKRITRYGTKYK